MPLPKIELEKILRVSGRHNNCGAHSFLHYFFYTFCKKAPGASRDLLAQYPIEVLLQSSDLPKATLRAYDRLKLKITKSLAMDEKASWFAVCEKLNAIDALTLPQGTVSDEQLLSAYIGPQLLELLLGSAFREFIAQEVPRFSPASDHGSFKEVFEGDFNTKFLPAMLQDQMVTDAGVHEKLLGGAHQLTISDLFNKLLIKCHNRGVIECAEAVEKGQGALDETTLKKLRAVNATPKTRRISKKNSLQFHQLLKRVNQHAFEVWYEQVSKLVESQQALEAQIKEFNETNKKHLFDSFSLESKVAMTLFGLDDTNNTQPYAKKFLEDNNDQLMAIAVEAIQTVHALATYGMGMPEKGFTLADLSEAALDACPEGPEKTRREAARKTLLCLSAEKNSLEAGLRVALNLINMLAGEKAISPALQGVLWSNKIAFNGGDITLRDQLYKKYGKENIFLTDRDLSNCCQLLKIPYLVASRGIIGGLSEAADFNDCYQSVCVHNLPTKLFEARIVAVKSEESVAYAPEERDALVSDGLLPVTPFTPVNANDCHFELFHPDYTNDAIIRHNQADQNRHTLSQSIARQLYTDNVIDLSKLERWLNGQLLEVGSPSSQEVPSKGFMLVPRRYAPWAEQFAKPTLSPQGLSKPGAPEVGGGSLLGCIVAQVAPAAFKVDPCTDWFKFSK